jgi:hypothetical protein
MQAASWSDPMVVAQDELVEPQVELEDAVRRTNERERRLDRVVEAGRDPRSRFGRFEHLTQTDEHLGALCELWMDDQSVIAPYGEARIVSDVRAQVEDIAPWQRRRNVAQRKTKVALLEGTPDGALMPLDE